MDAVAFSGSTVLVEEPKHTAFFVDAAARVTIDLRGLSSHCSWGGNISDGLRHGAGPPKGRKRIYIFEFAGFAVGWRGGASYCAVVVCGAACFSF